MRRKKTHQQLSDEYGIERSQLTKLKGRGVDIHKKEQVRLAILNQAKRPKGWESGCPWDEPAEKKDKDKDEIEFELADLCKIDISSLRDEVANCADYNEARFIKTKISALKELMQLSIAMGEHLPKSEVIDEIKMISNVISMALDKLPFDLPAVLEGLNATKMQGKIKTKVKEIKNQWHDLSNESYNDNK